MGDDERNKDSQSRTLSADVVARSAAGLERFLSETNAADAGLMLFDGGERRPLS